MALLGVSLRNWNKIQTFGHARGVSAVVSSPLPSPATGPLHLLFPVLGVLAPISLCLARCHVGTILLDTLNWPGDGLGAPSHHHSLLARSLSLLLLSGPDLSEITLCIQ